MFFYQFERIRRIASKKFSLSTLSAALSSTVFMTTPFFTILAFPTTSPRFTGAFTLSESS